MIAEFFNSGGVALVGFVVLAVEAVWLYRRGGPRVGAMIVAGAALLLALLAALRDWPWPWLALALTVALVAHCFDLRTRADV